MRRAAGSFRSFKRKGGGREFCRTFGVEEFCLSDAVKGQEPKESTGLVQRRAKKQVTRRSIQSGGIIVRLEPVPTSVDDSRSTRAVGLVQNDRGLARSKKFPRSF